MDFSPGGEGMSHQMRRDCFVLEKFMRKIYSGDNVKLVLLLEKTSTKPDRKVVITYVNNKYLYSLYVKPL
jgi:hypothetical protein